MKFLYQLLRVACFIVLPVFFDQKELTPQPIKNMLLAFIAGVITAELFLFFITASKLRTLFFLFPLIASSVMIFPYRGDLEYFIFSDQLTIAGTFLLCLIFYVDR